MNRLSNIERHLSSGKMEGNHPTVFDKENVPQAPEDPLFGLMAAYRKDSFEKKVDLGIGAYRDNNAKPWVLPVVKQADAILRNDPNLNHEYLPIAGLADFTAAAQKLILGADSPAITEKRVRTFPLSKKIRPHNINRQYRSRQFLVLAPSTLAASFSHASILAQRTSQFISPLPPGRIITRSSATSIFP